MKTKRKDVFEDDFSDFSLSSPATKIRRLDAEVLPVIEEELVSPVMDSEIEIESEASLPLNQERALVLYKPVHTMPSGVSVTVNPELVSGLRNDVFWYGRGSDQLLRPPEEQQDFEDKTSSSNNCLAVVPWVSNPNQLLVTEASEPMEAEEVGDGTMEIEYDAGPGMMVSPEQAGNVNGGVADVSQPWNQQHCMTSPPPPTTATSPIMWSL